MTATTEKIRQNKGDNETGGLYLVLPIEVRLAGNTISRRHD